MMAFVKIFICEFIHLLANVPWGSTILKQNLEGERHVMHGKLSQLTYKSRCN